MSRTRIISVSLTLGVIASGALAAYAVLASGGPTTAGDPTPGVDLSPDRTQGPGEPYPAGVPTPTPDVPEHATIDNAYARLAGEYPAVAEFVDAALTGDVDVALSYLQWREVECTADDPPHAGPRCSALGLRPGSTVEVALKPIGRMARANVAVEFEHFLSGTNPRLELVAQRDDGQLLVSVAIDTTQSPWTDTMVSSLLFWIEPGADAPVMLWSDRTPLATALDVIRDDERQVDPDERHEWEIWAASDELLERDAEVHRQRYDSPEARATPDLRR